jgi:tetratricopeptide (TPR) repeat protein
MARKSGRRLPAAEGAGRPGESTLLSGSPLYAWQRKFFEAQGSQAFSAGGVPSFITSNAFIAGAYAKVVGGWLRDCLAAAPREPGSFPPLDLRHPVYILELGCGSGRFGFHFLDRLGELLAWPAWRGVEIRYLFTDFAASQVEALAAHPRMEPLIAAGRVDFACLDAVAADGEIRLLLAGETLSPGMLRNPLVVIANYVFDGIPQEAYQVRDGRLHELRARLSWAADGGEAEEERPVEAMRVDWEEGPPAEPGGDEELDRILGEYAERLEGATFLFPAAAIGCLRRLARLADDRLLLLSADKGACHEALLDTGASPAIARHGSFSLMVNYHALGRFFAHRGGELLGSSHLQCNLVVVAGLLGQPPGGSAETHLAFDQAIERQGPDDFFQVAAALGQYDGSSLDQLLAWLRFAEWDSEIVGRCLPLLTRDAARATGVARLEIHRVALETWRRYFPIGESFDLAFQLGVLLCELELHAEALGLFEASLAAYGDNAATSFNFALCHLRLGDLAQAEKYLLETLAAAPDYEPAEMLRLEIEKAKAAAAEP